MGELTGDPARHVEPRANLVAGLADLAAVGHPAAVDERHRDPDDPAHGRREVIEQGEAFAVAQSPPARHDHVRRADVGALDPGVDPLGDPGDRRWRAGHGDRDKLGLCLHRTRRGFELSEPEHGQSGSPDPADLDADRIVQGQAESRPGRRGMTHVLEVPGDAKA